jgi:hypothetical protein
MVMTDDNNFIEEKTVKKSNQRWEQIQKKIRGGAMHIQQAAKTMLDDIREGTKISVCLAEKQSYFYKNSTLLIKENEYYQARRNVNDVLQILKNNYDNAEKWCLLPTTLLSSEFNILREQRLLESQQKVTQAHIIAQSMLVKNKHDVPANEEIISRIGGNKNKGFDLCLYFLYDL